MKDWADWLALAAVIIAAATFIVAIVAGVIAAIFARQTFLKLGGHEISRLREEWKERLRWNIAGLLELVERYKAAGEDQNLRQKLNARLVRRAARTKLMLTPGKHRDVDNEIDRLLESVGLSLDANLINISPSRDERNLGTDRGSDDGS